MKKVTLVFLFIALIVALMITPVFATGNGGTAAVTDAAGACGQTVRMTLSLAGFEEANTIGVEIITTDGLTVNTRHSEWLLEDGVLSDISGDVAAWAADSATNINGDVIEVGFTIPSANKAKASYEVTFNVMVKNGSTEIGKATAKGKITVTVPATGVTLSAEKLDLDLVTAKTADLTATVTPDNATEELTWKSSNPSVATVVDGKVTALKVGTATVTVTAGAKSDTCTVTVSCSHTEETVEGKDATCTATGLTDGKKCSVCGKVTVAQETIPVKAHTEVAVAGKAATCTATGLTDGKKCSVCGKVTLAQETIPVKAHTEVAVAGKAATCTATGLTEGKKCSVCGKVTVAQETIPVKAHTEVAVAGKAATCTATGLTEGKKCSVCGKVTVEQKSIEAKGHSYDNEYDDSCNNCGETREVGLPVTPMYRLYNPNSGEHFYTGSIPEKEMLVEAGWVYEGVAWNAPIYHGSPVHRMYNPNSGDHHYTMSEEEKEMLVNAGWIYEGVCWNSAPANHPLANTLHRLYNPNAECGSHHYTSSQEEIDMLVAAGWIYEGISWSGMIR